MYNVSLVKAGAYNQEIVDKAVQESIDLLGGINNFIKPNQRVALKVNLLMKADPERQATTHPSVVEALIKIIKEMKAIPFIVDSSGGPFNETYMNNVYKASGMTAVAKRQEVELNQNFNSIEVECPNAIVGKKFLILEALETADVIINVTKLKTHSFTGYTNAVKNMFGAIPGLTKVEMHGKYRTLDVFADFLYDIHDYFKGKLVLNITDAIMGMQGPGPSNGTPKKIGAILASANPLALDIVACKLINIDINLMPIINKGLSRKMVDSVNDIRILGEELEPLIIKDYEIVMPNNYKPFATIVPKFLQPLVHKVMTKRPIINKKQCKGCKKCYEHCPVKAISMVEYKKGQPLKAEIDYNKCIRCYCCQELCPYGVVKVKSGIIYRIVNHKQNKKSKK